MSDHPTPRTYEFLSDPSNGFQSLVYFAHRLEHELADAQAAILKMHKDLGYELRDPNGTIWDEASRLKRERDMLYDCISHLQNRDWFRDGVTGPVVCSLDADKVRAALAKVKS